MPGIKALVLGGSHARGTAHAGSDIDIGLYYSESNPFDIEAIREVAKRINPDAVVTGTYEWGPWVNGGAWLGGIDLLYRSLEHVERVIEEAQAGKISWDFQQQPPFGYYSVTYLGETKSCVPLYDPDRHIERLKRRVEKYPEAMRRAIVQENLWGAEFSLLYARKAKGYALAGCITRVLSHLTQVLFALKREYFISDREVESAYPAGNLESND